MMSTFTRMSGMVKPLYSTEYSACIHVLRCQPLQECLAWYNLSTAQNIAYVSVMMSTFTRMSGMVKPLYSTEYSVYTC